MVKIRLKRIGSKFNAYYRIVVTDARAPRDGRFIEEIGTYNPHKKLISIEEESWKNWLSKGAIPTQVTKNLFKEYEIAKTKGDFKNGLITLIKKPKKRKSKKELKNKDLEDNKIKEVEVKAKSTVENKEKISK